MDLLRPPIIPTPCSLNRCSISPRLCKVLGAKYNYKSTVEALNTLSKLYAAPSASAKGKKVQHAHEDDFQVVPAFRMRKLVGTKGRPSAPVQPCQTTFPGSVMDFLLLPLWGRLPRAFVAPSSTYFRKRRKPNTWLIYTIDMPRGCE